MKRNSILYLSICLLLFGAVLFSNTSTIPLIESATVNLYSVTKDEETGDFRVREKEEFTINEKEALRELRFYLDKIAWESERHLVEMAYHEGIRLTVQYEDGETQVFRIWPGYNSSEIKSNGRYGKLKGKNSEKLNAIISFERDK